MEQLRRNVIQDIRSFPNVTIGTIKSMPERVLQFGEGNFLRAFVDWQFNELITAGMFNGSIVVVQPLENGMVNMLNDQEGLYTVVQRGYDNGTLVEKMDVITAISRGINPYIDYQEFLKCASNPDLRFIISNTTESGIEYVDQPMPAGTCPDSYPAKVAILLFERFKAFSGDPARGMILIPCELIEQNGDALKTVVLHHARDWNCGDAFVQWIEKHNHFCNTLVDRIVPGYPKEEAAELTGRLGYHDQLIVACEVFHKWVIQGDPVVQKELPFEKIGLNVVWTKDITLHRTLKVRILNGAHTTFTIPAMFYGKEFVKECMDDNVTGAFIRDAVIEEILPTLDFNAAEKERFASAVLERFRNPFIKHALASITLNSVSKYKVRVLPSLLEFQHRHQRLPKRLCVGLAALIRLYKPSGKGPRGFVSSYDGKEYAIQDSDDVVEMFRNEWQAHADDLPTLVRHILARQELWGRDISTVPQLAVTVTELLRTIDAGHIAETLRSTVAGSWVHKMMMHKNY